MTPLSTVPLDHAANFNSEQCSDGLVAISGDTLRILTVERLGETFNTQSVPLLHTPRRFAIHPSTNHLVILETDRNSMSLREREQLKQQLDPDLPSLEEQRLYGEPKPLVKDYWASCVRLLDVKENKTLDLVELDPNEGAFSMCTSVFKDRGGEVYIIVGTATNISLHPLTAGQGYLYVFRVKDSKQLELLHKVNERDLYMY